LMPRDQRWPFCFRFLHAVFTEDPLTRSNDRRDVICGNRL